MHRKCGSGVIRVIIIGGVMKGETVEPNDVNDRVSWWWGGSQRCCLWCWGVGGRGGSVCDVVACGVGGWAVVVGRRQQGGGGGRSIGKRWVGINGGV